MNLKLFMVILMCLNLQINGWRQVGHMLAARIAEIRLAELNPFAGSQFKDLIQSINKLCDERSQTFVESACWPDDIKSKQYSMNLWDSWHFINSPYTVDATSSVINITQAALSAIKVIYQAAKVLKTNIVNKSAERALFARYIIHLIGDIHQPLHSVALFNQTYKRGDRGGNLLRIKILNGSLVNFHSFWDFGAFRIENQSFFMPRPLNRTNLLLLTGLANEMIQQYGRQVQGLALNMVPQDWAIQSFKIAKNTTYKPMFHTNVADQAYTALAYETSKKRITLAGYRLANFIMDIYSNSSISQSLQSQTLWDKMMREVTLFQQQNEEM